MEPARNIAPESAYDQTDFDAIAEEHRLWIESEGREGRRANLRDADLRYITFSAACLAKANLRGADLRGCDLRKAALSEADLTEANLSSSDLSEADLTGCNFTGASLERCVLDGATMQDANFTNAQLTEASLKSAHLTNAVFRQTNAERCRFDHANLSGLVARGCRMQGAHFDQTKMNHADFREADFDQAQFIGVFFEQTQCRAATFEGVSFGESDFSEALEVGAGYLASAFAQEKQRMQEEKKRLAGLEESLQTREELVSAKHNETLEQNKLWQNQQEREFQGSIKIGNYARWLATMSALWLLLFTGLAAGIFLTLSSLDRTQWNVNEMAVVFGGGGLIVLLAFGTFAGAAFAAKELKKISVLRERKRFTQYSEKNDDISHPVAPPLFASQPSLSLPYEFAATAEGQPRLSA